MTKRIIALVACFIIALPFVPAYAYTPEGLMWDGVPATLDRLSDLTGIPFAATDGSYIPVNADAAEWLWYRGLFLGSDGSFRLDEPLRRVEGAVMIVRLLGAEGEAMANPGSHPFTDVPQWAAPYVAYVYNNNITKGVSDKLFGSDGYMTASQFITFVLRVLGYEDGVDFEWTAAAAKAVEIGLADDAEGELYSRSNLFMRDHAAALCKNALGLRKRGGMSPLIELITLPEPNTGTPPAATLNVPEGEPHDPDGGGNMRVKLDLFDITTDNMLYMRLWFSVSAGLSGNVEFGFNMDGNNLGTRVFNVTKGETYILSVELKYGGGFIGVTKPPWTAVVTVNGEEHSFSVLEPLMSIGQLGSVTLTRRT